MRLWAFLSLTVCLLAAQAMAGTNSTNRRTKRQFEADRCDPSYCKIPVSFSYIPGFSPLYRIYLTMISVWWRKFWPNWWGKLSHICQRSENTERQFVIVRPLNKLETHLSTQPVSQITTNTLPDISITEITKSRSFIMPHFIGPLPLTTLRSPPLK